MAVLRADDGHRAFQVALILDMECMRTELKAVLRREAWSSDYRVHDDYYFPRSSEINLFGFVMLDELFKEEVRPVPQAASYTFFSAMSYREEREAMHIMLHDDDR